VLKEMLAWDPALGVLLTRLPSRFISPNPRAGRDVEAEVGELARNLDHNDAFVIFPEGGNFTPERRDRAIKRLHRLGMTRMATRAEEMINVLAPRPGGVLAALEAAPEADVLLVAHTGLDHVLTVADVWHSLPMDKRLLMGWWRIPREEIPHGRDERIEWLFEWWRHVDEWIDTHRPVDLPPRQRRRRRHHRPPP
jgi:1-acyl-sn-glycerol-3-phosphate acyltransferase